MTKSRFFCAYYDLKSQLLQFMCKIIGHKWQKSNKLDTYNQYICKRCRILATIGDEKMKKLSFLSIIVAIFVGFLLGFLIFYYLLAKFQLDWQYYLNF